jgi:hypothetical protein
LPRTHHHLSEGHITPCAPSIRIQINILLRVLRALRGANCSLQDEIALLQPFRKGPSTSSSGQTAEPQNVQPQNIQGKRAVTECGLRYSEVIIRANRRIREFSRRRPHGAYSSLLSGARKKRGLVRRDAFRIERLPPPTRGRWAARDSSSECYSCRSQYSLDATLNINYDFTEFEVEKGAGRNVLIRSV